MEGGGKNKTSESPAKQAGDISSSFFLPGTDLLEMSVVSNFRAVSTTCLLVSACQKAERGEG